jgi:hypothetical protein
MKEDIELGTEASEKLIQLLRKLEKDMTQNKV